VRDLTQDDFSVAFSFARSAAGSYRDAAGVVRSAAVDVPRFDHDEAGAPLGLLIAPGADIGEHDRIELDPFMLPEDLVTGIDDTTRRATILHAFTPAGETALRRNAWYSRNTKFMVDALLRQAGRHQSIGVIEGFRINLGGLVRYRGHDWWLPGVLQTEGASLIARGELPLISSGAVTPDA